MIVVAGISGVSMPRTFPRPRCMAVPAGRLLSEPFASEHLNDGEAERRSEGYVAEGPWRRTVAMNHVRRLALMIGFTIFLLSSVAHATLFIIELNNGQEVITPRVWEEGDEVKFSIYQGSAGVPRALVKRIKTSTPVNSDKVAPSSIPLSSAVTNKPTENISQKETDLRDQEGNFKSEGEKKHVSDVTREGEELMSDRQKKAKLTSQLDEATKRYREASEASNLDAKKTALNEMREYRNKIFKLRDEVKSKNEGELPTWWNE